MYTEPSGSIRTEAHLIVPIADLELIAIGSITSSAGRYPLGIVQIFHCVLAGIVWVLSMIALTKTRLFLQMQDHSTADVPDPHAGVISSYFRNSAKYAFFQQTERNDEHE